MGLPAGFHPFRVKGGSEYVTRPKQPPLQTPRDLGYQGLPTDDWWLSFSQGGGKCTQGVCRKTQPAPPPISNIPGIRFVMVTLTKAKHMSSLWAPGGVVWVPCGAARGGGAAGRQRRRPRARGLAYGDMTKERERRGPESPKEPIENGCERFPVAADFKFSLFLSPPAGKGAICLEKRDSGKLLRVLRGLKNSASGLL